MTNRDGAAGDGGAQDDAATHFEPPARRAVSVVIPCGRRPDLLRRAVGSVERQTYDGPVEILLIASHGDDEARRQIERIAAAASLPCRLLDVTELIEASANGLVRIYGAAQIAFKRNIGVRRAHGEVVAHLDDDNRWQADHLDRLAATLQTTGAPLAHSWRNLLTAEGEPFVQPVYPWIKKPDRVCAEHIYQELVRLGVRVEGSCQVRDAFLGPDGEELFTVDSSEWIVSVDLARAVQFRERPDFRSVSHWLSDDLMFCRDLRAHGVAEVPTSAAFTLDYYLGGRSTGWLSAVSG